MDVVLRPKEIPKRAGALGHLFFGFRFWAIFYLISYVSDTQIDSVVDLDWIIKR